VLDYVAQILFDISDSRSLFLFCHVVLREPCNILLAAAILRVEVSEKANHVAMVYLLLAAIDATAIYDSLADRSTLNSTLQVNRSKHHYVPKFLERPLFLRLGICN
jgi:hypothetical protein